MTLHDLAHDAGIAVAIFILVAYLAILLGRGGVRPDRQPVPGEYGPNQRSGEREAGELSGGGHGERSNNG